MKKALILLFVVIFTGSFLSQVRLEAKIPAVVKESFVKLYPDIKKVKWTHENQNYEASFKQNGNDMSLNFDNKGKVLETETGLKISELPKVILDYVKENCKGYKISEAAKMVNAKGVVTYEAEISKGKLRKDLIFDSTGKLLNGK